METEPAPELGGWMETAKGFEEPGAKEVPRPDSVPENTFWLLVGAPIHPSLVTPHRLGK